MAKNLRTYLDEIEKAYPEAILRIQKPMRVAYEISALQRKLDAEKRYPIMIIEKPILDNGDVSRFPLVTNLTASRELCAETLGIHPQRVAMEYRDRVANRIDPVMVSRDEAPVKEVIETGGEVDSIEIPHLHPQLYGSRALHRGRVCHDL